MAPERSARAPRLRLVRLDRENGEADVLRRSVLRHRLAPGQAKFTGLPVATLPAADADESRTPFAIVLAATPVTTYAEAGTACTGFAVLDRNIRNPEMVDTPENAVLLRAFYVTPEWQGRGVGRISCSAPLLDNLVAEVAPHATEIVLCVNEGNQSAARVYRRAGFGFTGKIIPGTAGPQWVMNRPLQERTEDSQ